MDLGSSWDTWVVSYCHYGANRMGSRLGEALGGAGAAELVMRPRVVFGMRIYGIATTHPEGY